MRLEGEGEERKMVTSEGIVPVQGGLLTLLDEEQIKTLHEATVELLNDVGIRLLHHEALEIMRGCGCITDLDEKKVKIPEEVLMKYLANAPYEVTLFGRDSKYDITLNPSNDVYVMGGAGALNVIDLDGVRRPSTLQDLRDLTRLEDTLEHMDIAHFLVTPQDIPQDGFEMITFAEMLKNNTRNFYALVGGCREGLNYELEMAAVAAGNIDEVKKKPFFVGGLCVISPLTHPEDFVEELFACGENHIPVYIEADALAGGTTPYTISGTAVEINANVLAAVALAQMANPGAPCIYASSSGILDMRSLNLGGSAPESTLLHMAQAQLAHHYSLPYYGSNTPDSKLPDTQMGYESALHFLGCAMGGVNIIHVAIGNLEMMSLANYEKCLIDNEILGATFRMLGGIDCSRDAIGLDAFREVKHSGQFIQTEHTLRYLRKDRWEPGLTDRNSWTKWQAQAGGKDMRERARDKAREILKQHHPVYIGEREASEIDRIAHAAQAEIAALRKKKLGT
jgi:trimethylamine--corrinoid protein Co-methyltransferase